MNKMQPMTKPTILIVDDEPELLISFSLLLGGEFNVLTAINDMEALSTIKDVPDISLLLVDLKMPGLSGIELIECLRDAGCKVPTIVLTGNPHWDADSLEELRVSVIQKPVGAGMLIARIKEALGIC